MNCNGPLRVPLNFTVEDASALFIALTPKSDILILLFISRSILSGLISL